MALPLILWGAVAAASATGLYKGGKAIVKNSEANDVNDSAKSLVRRSESKMEDSRNECEKMLSDYGQAKASILTGEVKDFLDTFLKIKNVELKTSLSIGNIKLNEFGLKAIKDLSSSINFVLDSGIGLGGGAVGGALTAYGAYSGVMALGTAGTGAAIGGLSGAAATNATLAWLGGGTLAAGGGGMAAGALVLGGITAAPALLIAGWYMDSKAETKLNDAYSNKAKAEEFAAQAKTAIDFTDGIKSVAKEAHKTLSTLKSQSRNYLTELKFIIQQTGPNYQNYSQSERNCVAKNIAVIQLIKAMLETPILDKNGNLLADNKSNIFEISKIVHAKAIN